MVGDPPFSSEMLPEPRHQSAAPDELRRVRPAGPAACLRRRHQTNRSAFVRIDPRLTARQAWSRSSFNLRQPHPAPSRSRRVARAPSRARRSLRTIPSRLGPRLATRPSGSGKDASLRLLQPTLRYEHSADVRFPSLPLPRPCGLASCWSPHGVRGDNPGGASLDGDPPASVAIPTLAARLVAVKPVGRACAGVVRS